MIIMHLEISGMCKDVQSTPVIGASPIHALVAAQSPLLVSLGEDPRPHITA